MGALRWFSRYVDDNGLFWACLDILCVILFIIFMALVCTMIGGLAAFTIWDFYNIEIKAA